MGIPGNRIVIHISGKDKSDGDVSLINFTKQLELFYKALNETVKNVVKTDEKVKFMVVELKKQSPAQVVIEIQTKENKSPDYGEMTVDCFFSALESISKREWPEQFDYDTLDSYKSLFSLEKKNKLNIGFSRNGEKKIEGQSITGGIDELIGPLSKSVGSWSGMLDALNFHGENLIYIYPTIDFPRIQCVLPDSLMENVSDSIRKYVTVYGDLFYHPKIRGGAPIKILVKEIVTHPYDQDLPTLSDLRGINFDTGGLDSVEFVRKLRDEW